MRMIFAILFLVLSACGPAKARFAGNSDRQDSLSAIAATAATTANGATAATTANGATTQSKVTSCDGAKSGSNQSRTMYKDAIVARGERCEAEEQVRSCTTGEWSAWSGTFSQQGCNEEGSVDCGSIKHGTSEKRTMFEEAQVPFGDICVSEEQTRACTNGAFSGWSGTFANSSCEVGRDQSCAGIAEGTTEERIRFRNATEAFGGTCQSETQRRTCAQGSFSGWTGTFTAPACTVLPALDCGSLAHEASRSRTRYRDASVAFGGTCVSQQQTQSCNNGVLSPWSGTYTNERCTVAGAANCGAIVHGSDDTRVRYRASVVPFGSTCTSETQRRTCSNGTFGNWTGTYTFTSCSAASPASCGSIPHNGSDSRVRYLSSAVNWDQACQSQTQTRSCWNGSFSAWSGTYTATSCTQNPRPVFTLRITGLNHEAAYRNCLYVQVGNNSPEYIGCNHDNNFDGSSRTYQALAGQCIAIKLRVDVTNNGQWVGSYTSGETNRYRFQQTYLDSNIRRYTVGVEDADDWDYDDIQVSIDIPRSSFTLIGTGVGCE